MGERIWDDERVNGSKRPPLRRAQSDSANMPAPWLGGVAAGIAANFGVDVRLVRAAFIVASIPFGLALFPYTWLWITLPADGEEASEWPSSGLLEPLRAITGRRDRETLSGQLALVGIGFLGIGALAAASGLLWEVPWQAIIGGLMVLFGPVFSWMQAPKFAKQRNLEALGYVLVGLGVTVVGVILLLAEAGVIPGMRVGFTVGASVIAGLALALIPLGVRVLDDLSNAKAREAREAERADIAAHLHDSVLQTLTLLRARAGDEDAVRALALAQERELRSWMYSGRTLQGSSVARDIEERVAEVEATYGVPIEVVTVGDMHTGEVQAAGLEAATEAVVNAVKHGAPPISVYQEVRGPDLEIFVKDAGDGFDTQNIPSDRHGFTGSIVGRVERVGGKVSVRILPGAGQEAGGKQAGGTEIRIFLPGRGEEG